MSFLLGLLECSRARLEGERKQSLDSLPPAPAHSSCSKIDFLSELSDFQMVSSLQAAEGERERKRAAKRLPAFQVMAPRRSAPQGLAAANHTGPEQRFVCL